MSQIQTDPNTFVTPVSPLSNEDLLYLVIDKMSKPELDQLHKDIEEEIELRKFKEKRLRQVKLEISKETDKLITQAKLKINKAKHVVLDDDEEDEVIEPRQKRRSGKK